jgi:glycosyltransferase involved in cell wall biosynthesis
VGENSSGNSFHLPAGVESDLSRHASGPNGGTWTNVHLVSSRKTLVAIPAWNEEGSIAEVIGRIQLHEPDADILVVNDGSTDSTALVASDAGAIVVSLPFNVGVGGAMRTAFLYAFREGYQAIVQVDADGQHEPAELNALIAGLDHYDIVVGTRFHPNSTYNVKGPRRWAMRLLSRTLSKMAKSPITDPTSGFRSAGIRAIQLFHRNYPAEYLGDTVGSLAIAIRTGLTVGETPVTMYYREIGRPSKNAVWSTLYLGRASLALLVNALKRTAPRREEEA